MKLWGLTGGIASGKSTVAQTFATLGVPVVNADAVYHDLLKPVQGAPSAVAQRIAALFAALDLLRPDGTFDRAALGAHVFADAAARARLEAVAHPAVAEATAARLQALRQAGVAMAIYDVPLLFEKDMAAAFDGVIVVWVPRDVQVQRLMARDGIDAPAAERRLAAQLPLDDKRDRAHWVIDNSGSQTATEAQVRALCHTLRAA